MNFLIASFLFTHIVFGDLASEYATKQNDESDAEHLAYYPYDYYSDYGLNSDYQEYYNNNHNYNFQETSRLRGAKSYRPKKPARKVFVPVPVVLKKKAKKKSKIIAVHKGFFTPGGTQIFGKFKDLYTCKKACELTPTCFAGDFNPWFGKCYFHSNLTSCDTMKSHKAIIHFTKVPCDMLPSSRSYIVLGVSVLFGIEVKGIDNLQDCIKKCATAGNGIAATDADVNTHPQVCCHLDYDFTTHKCYMHACISTAFVNANFCPATETTISVPPLQSIANPGCVSITLCPRSTAPAHVPR